MRKQNLLTLYHLFSQNFLSYWARLVIVLPLFMKRDIQMMDIDWYLSKTQIPQTLNSNLYSDICYSETYHLAAFPVTPSNIALA